MDWQNIVGISGALVAIGSLAGIGLIRDRLQNLSALNDELDKRVNFLEKASARDAVEKAELRTEIATLTHDAEVLRSVVRDRANYETAIAQLDEALRLIVAIHGHSPKIDEALRILHAIDERLP